MSSPADWPSVEPRPRHSPRFIRQVWLQIYLPLFVGILLLIGLVVLVRRSAVGTASVWADASTVFLLIPVIVIGLLFMLASIALAIGLGYLIGWWPGPIRKGWEVFVQVEAIVRRGADLAVRPMLTAKGLSASVRQGVEVVASVFRAGQG